MAHKQRDPAEKERKLAEVKRRRMMDLKRRKRRPHRTAVKLPRIT